MATDERRTYDLVLFGATGFTGGLTAEYLVGAAPADCRWAIAGRDPAKLAAVQARLAALDPTKPEVPTVVVDAADAAGLADLARQSRVIVTTVGPYLRYGEPLVAACAAAGTDYLDLTGEPEFVDRMYVQHHQTAVASGARLVHCCGFDSIPHDLGVLFTLEQLPAGVPVTIDGYVQAGGRPSGGTFHSAVTAFSRLRPMAQAARARAKAEPELAGRVVRAGAGRPGHRQGWALPMPSIDPQIVGRSAAALERYGPDFTYRHHVVVDHLASAAGVAVGAGAVLAMAQLPPTRKFLLGRIQPGDGPTEEQRAKSWFRVGFDGVAGGQRVMTEVSGGDPGYSETAKMLSETALCLAFDDVPETRGQTTTAAAAGDALIARLQRAGIRFAVLATHPA